MRRCIENDDFYNSLTSEEQLIADWASLVAVDTGLGISRVQEATAVRMLADRMEINSVPASELARFAAAPQPAVEKLIEESYGKEGIDMLESFKASIAASQ